jgi:hypothetical protein
MVLDVEALRVAVHGSLEAAAYFREVGLRGPFWGLPEDD